MEVIAFCIQKPDNFPNNRQSFLSHCCIPCSIERLCMIHVADPTLWDKTLLLYYFCLWNSPAYNHTVGIYLKSCFCNVFIYFIFQGVIWVLECDKIPDTPPDKPSKDKRRKKEILEVSPVRKHGKIKRQSLILTDPDGLRTLIQLKGCKVEAVSSTNLPSKKWYCDIDASFYLVVFFIWNMVDMMHLLFT